MRFQHSNKKLGLRGSLGGSVFGKLIRTTSVLPMIGVNFIATCRWVWEASEVTNFDYEISPQSKSYGIMLLSQILKRDIEELEAFALEIENDVELFEYLSENAAKSPIRGILRKNPILGRRIFWYVIVRATKPDVVIVTGTDKSLGAAILSRALQKNGNGVLYTVDIVSPRGYLKDSGRLNLPIKFITMNSHEFLSSFNFKIDLFLHDSNHEYAYETGEYSRAFEKLSSRGILLSDNAYQNSSLYDFARSKNLSFFNIENTPLDFPFERNTLGFARK